MFQNIQSWRGVVLILGFWHFSICHGSFDHMANAHAPCRQGVDNGEFLDHVAVPSSFAA